MASTSGATAQTSLIYFIAILLLIVAIRLRRVINGTRVSLARTIGYSSYYVFFALLVLSGSFFIGIPVDYFGVYAIVFAASTIGSYKISRKRLVFWTGAGDSTLYSKGGLEIYLVYIAGLILRLLIGYVFIGPSYFFYGTEIVLSQTAIVATTITDLILIFGVGLLFGRNMQIIRRYRAIKQGKETVSVENHTPNF